MEQFAQIEITTPDGQPGRLLLAEPSVLGIGKYNRYLRQAQEAINGHYGLPETEPDEDADDWLIDDRVLALNFVPNWAALMTCLVRFEVQGEDGAWHVQPFPWSDPLSYLSQLPHSDQTRCRDAARALAGPLLGWSPLSEDDQKKLQSGTIAWLTRLPLPS